MFGHFTQLVADASGWAYGIVFLLAMLDSILPVVPSETAAITAGVVAGAGDLSLWVVIVAAAAGAFVGDNIAYAIGHLAGDRIVARVIRGEKGQHRLDWAERQLQERGGVLIIGARFIPGGRTAVTISAGLLGYPWRRFVAFDLAAALLWASYATLLGYWGGKTFEHAPWKGLVVALGLAFTVAIVVEGVRWLRRRLAS